MTVRFRPYYGVRLSVASADQGLVGCLVSDCMYYHEQSGLIDYSDGIMILVQLLLAITTTIAGA